MVSKGSGVDVCVGDNVGASVALVGKGVGAFVGIFVGVFVGVLVGVFVGDTVGCRVGNMVGFDDGSREGMAVGNALGSGTGTFVAVPLVGDAVSSPCCNAGSMTPLFLFFVATVETIAMAKTRMQRPKAATIQERRDQLRGCSFSEGWDEVFMRKSSSQTPSVYTVRLPTLSSS